MKKVWHEKAWAEYVEWQSQDRKTLRRINALLQAIDRDPYDGIGKPEPLRHDRQGYWSRRIDDQNRIVYRVEGEMIIIVQCGSHYGE
jgi:toxin YoeB